MNKLLLLLPFFLIGCGDNDFKKVEKLEGFRILAIESSSPEVAPGSSSTLRLFVYDSVGRSVSGTITSCIDPGITLGAPVSCAHDPTSVPSPISFSTVGHDRGAAYASINPTVTIPGTILDGRSNRAKINGVGFITIFNLNIDGNVVTAFKRIVATQRASKNTNPSSSKILLNNLDFPGNPKKGDVLTFLTSPPESYDYINIDDSVETRREEFQVAWFITEGEFDKPKSGVSEAVEITKDTLSTSYVIIGIVRDDRGGVDIVKQNVL